MGYPRGSSIHEKLRPHRVMVGHQRGNHFGSLQFQAGVEKNVIKHVGHAPPGDFAFLSRLKSQSGELLDQALTWHAIEIAGQYRRPLDLHQRGRHGVSLLRVLRARGADHEKRLQMRVHQIDLRPAQNRRGTEKQP